jgi:drug/metabolite transporter (DMT)-like permease
MHLVPLFGSFMAFVFLGESLRPYHLAGVALIGTGIALAQVTARPRKRRLAPEPMTT